MEWAIIVFISLLQFPDVGSSADIRTHLKLFPNIQSCQLYKAKADRALHEGMEVLALRQGSKCVRIALVDIQGYSERMPGVE